MVQDHKVHEEVIEKIQDFCFEQWLFRARTHLFSGEGPGRKYRIPNLSAEIRHAGTCRNGAAAAAIVEESHLQLDKS